MQYLVRGTRLYGLCTTQSIILDQQPIRCCCRAGYAGFSHIFFFFFYQTIFQAGHIRNTTYILSAVLHSLRALPYFSRQTFIQTFTNSPRSDFHTDRKINIRLLYRKCYSLFCPSVKILTRDSGIFHSYFSEHYEKITAYILECVYTPEVLYKRRRFVVLLQLTSIKKSVKSQYKKRKPQQLYLGLLSEAYIICSIASCRTKLLILRLYII